MIKVNNSSSSSTMKEEATIAKISYYMEVLWSLINFLILSCWISCASMDNEQEQQDAQWWSPPSCVFAPSFFENGFCQVESTHFACGVVDVGISLLGVLILWMYPMYRKIGSFMILYTLIHGVSHYAMHVGWIVPLETKPLEHLIPMAIILSIGPMLLSLFMIQEGQPKWMILIVAILAESVMVYGFLFFREVDFLTYANVSINFVVFLPRILLIGYSTSRHIESRHYSYTPYFVPMMIAITCMHLVMLAESFLCDAGFGVMGGHVWFDVSLIAIVTLVTAKESVHAQQRQSKEGKRD